MSIEISLWKLKFKSKIIDRTVMFLKNTANGSREHPMVPILVRLVTEGIGHQMFSHVV